MTDKEFLTCSRRQMAIMTIIWAFVFGIPLFLVPYLKYGSLFWGLMFGIGWGICPLLFSTIINWNDTSRYS